MRTGCSGRRAGGSCAGTANALRAAPSDASTAPTMNASSTTLPWTTTSVTAPAKPAAAVTSPAVLASPRRTRPNHPAATPTTRHESTSSPVGKSCTVATTARTTAAAISASAAVAAIRQAGDDCRGAGAQARGDGDLRADSKDDPVRRVQRLEAAHAQVGAILGQARNLALDPELPGLLDLELEMQSESRGQRVVARTEVGR